MAYVVYGLCKKITTSICLCLDEKILEDTLPGVNSGYLSRGGEETR